MAKKNSLLVLILLVFTVGYSQTTFPSFLVGTWKIEDKNEYEHWDYINGNTLKGFAYRLDSGAMVVTEYLDLYSKDKNIIYTATVPNQNNGKGVNFVLHQTDSTYSFENLHHDFPKKIVYKRISATKIMVTVWGENREFSFILLHL